MTNTKLYLMKRSNGYYYLGWYDNGNRRWISTKCRGKSDALQYLREFKGRTEKAEIVPTASSLWVRYSESKGRELRNSTLNLYDISVKEFIKMCGDKTIDRYTMNEVERFKNALLDRGLSKTTANIYYRSAKSVFGLAVRNGWIDRSPFTRTQQFPIPQQTPTYMTKEELQKLISAVKEPVLKDLFLFASLTGFRLSEILNMTWDCVDFHKRQILIANTENFTTKSGKVRSVPMHEEVERLLRARFREKGYVFCKQNGFPLQKSYVSHRFKDYVREMRLSEKLHFHSLRHTCASWLVDAGVSLYVVQKILGHASITTTQIYSHLSENTLLESVNKVSFG